MDNIGKNSRYHAAHRETILARQRARYALKRETDLARKRAWRLANKEAYRAQCKRLYDALPPHERQRRNKIYNKKYKAARDAWTERNMARVKRLAAEWVRANRNRTRAKSARRKARKLRATPSWANTDAIQLVYDEAARLTKETGIRHEVDHIVPLTSPVVCGLHVEYNLRVITQTENRRKNNRLIAA